MIDITRTMSIHITYSEIPHLKSTRGLLFKRETMTISRSRFIDTNHTLNSSIFHHHCVSFTLIIFFFFFVSSSSSQKKVVRNHKHEGALFGPKFLNLNERRDFDDEHEHVQINMLTSDGYETVPIGYARIFRNRVDYDDDDDDGVKRTSFSFVKEEKGKFRKKGSSYYYPDVFVAQKGGKFEKINVYEYVGIDEGKTYAPFFRKRNHATHPFTGLKPPSGKCVSQNSSTNEIYGFFVVEGTILARSRYDEASGGFVGRRETHVTGIRGKWQEIENVVCVPGRTDFVYLLVNDYKKMKFREANETRAKRWKYEAPRYNANDGAKQLEDEEENGIIETSIWKLEVGEVEDAKDSARAKKAKMPLTTNDEIEHLPIVSAFGLEDGSIVFGHSGGEITWYRKNKKNGENEDDFLAHERILNVEGFSLEAHPTPNAAPMPYPVIKTKTNSNNYNEDDDAKRKEEQESEKRNFDLLVGGVGSLYHYKRAVVKGFDDTTPTKNNMVFFPPRVCGEENAKTFVASLGTISLVDLDNDGREDIVSGSAEGVLYALKNIGTNLQPSFMPPSAIETKSKLKDKDIILRIVPNNERVSLHGPRESRFGYTTAATIDWNEDGKFDIVVNDFSGKLSILENIGKPTAMKFDTLIELKRENDNGDRAVFKTHWRVKPYVGKIGKNLILIAPCPETSILLVFEKIGDYLVKKVGALKLNDGKDTRVSTHALFGGARGRLSIDVVDFDGDDVLDILLTVPKHASVPDPENGLPLHEGHYQAALLFLKGKSINITSNGDDFLDSVRFEFPEIVKYKGKPMYVGKMQGSVVATNVIGTTVTDDSSISAGGLPHLMVVCDAGRVYWYDRKDLSTLSIPSFRMSKDVVIGKGNFKKKSKVASRELELGWAVEFLPGTSSPQCEAFNSRLASAFSRSSSGRSRSRSIGDAEIDHSIIIMDTSSSSFSTVLLVCIFLMCVMISYIGWTRFWMFARRQFAGRFNVSLGRSESREV